MKVEVKKVDKLRREMKFEVSKDRVSKKMDEVYDEIAKSAKMKGFRKGKAPRKLLEQEHGQLAKEETLQKIIPEVYQEGLQQEDLNPVDFPEIHDVAFKDGVITFTAKFDVRPEVNVKNYKGIKVKRKEAKVTDEEVMKTLEYFKKGQGGDDKVKIDDEFAKGLGLPSLEELKKSMSRQLEMDKDRQNRIEVENQIVDDLIKNAKLAIPESLVKKQEAHRLEEMRKHFESHGMAKEEIEKKQEEAKPSLKPAVERDIKVYFILEKIAQMEGIKQEEGKNLMSQVMEFLLKEAKWEEK